MAGHFFLFIVMVTSLIIVPGPHMLYVVGQSITRGRLACWYSTLRTASGYAVFTILVAVGVGFIFEARPGLFIPHHQDRRAALSYIPRLPSVHIRRWTPGREWGFETVAKSWFCLWRLDEHPEPQRHSLPLLDPAPILHSRLQPALATGHHLWSHHQPAMPAALLYGRARGHTRATTMADDAEAEKATVAVIRSDPAACHSDPDRQDATAWRLTSTDGSSPTPQSYDKRKPMNEGPNFSSRVLLIVILVVDFWRQHGAHRWNRDPIGDVAGSRLAKGDQGRRACYHPTRPRDYQ